MANIKEKNVAELELFGYMEGKKVFTSKGRKKEVCKDFDLFKKMKLE